MSELCTKRLNPSSLFPPIAASRTDARATRTHNSQDRYEIRLRYESMSVVVVVVAAVVAAASLDPSRRLFYRHKSAQPCVTSTTLVSRDRLFSKFG